MRGERLSGFFPMPSRSALLSLLVAALVGGGCVYGSADAPVSVTSATASSTVPVEEAPVAYRDLFRREAEPEWRTVSFGDVSLSVPYSPKWRFADVGLSVYDADQPLDSRGAIRFGRPSDAGTYVSREYDVSRRRLIGPRQADAVAVVLVEMECVDGYVARRVTVGGIRGVQYHAGGAKGCALGFAFQRGDYLYYVNKIPDLGQPTPEIDAEMERVIKGIRASGE